MVTPSNAMNSKSVCCDWTDPAKALPQSLSQAGLRLERENIATRRRFRMKRVGGVLARRARNRTESLFFWVEKRLLREHAC
jgi:hypothetical protein